jgi:LemA protein
MSMLILIGLIVVVGFWFVSAYNGLIALKNQVANAWKQIDVQLKRRHDLIPNLIESVKGAMNFEKSTLEAVVQARNTAIAAGRAGDAGLPNAQQVQQTAAAEGQLTGALGRLFAVVEAYPDLKATGNIKALQEELTSTENKIAFARQAYNDSVMEYNTRRESFPGNVFAGAFGFGAAEMLQATESAEERRAPKVAF